MYNIWMHCDYHGISIKPFFTKKKEKNLQLVILLHIQTHLGEKNVRMKIVGIRMF